MEAVLRTEHLTKTFGNKAAVNDVSMTIEKGDIYGFIGKNGAGKTTLMRLVLNLIFPTSGTIELFGESKLTKANLSRTGSLIEAPTLFLNCSARENLKRFAILYGADNNDIENVLKEVDLTGTGNKKAGKFSFGMKQRLGIAIALLGNPDFIILDEPVNGLDPEGMKEIRDLILRLNREKGTTFLISSHLIDELSKVVTKYGIIRDGVLVEEISAENLKKKCTHTLKITVDNVDGAKALLSAAYGNDCVSVDGGTVVISDHNDESAEINKKLFENGFSVSGIETAATDIESYFIEMMGGEL